VWDRALGLEAGGDLLQFLVLGHCWNKGDMGLRARALR
jgi:hypothetical protein